MQDKYKIEIEELVYLRRFLHQYPEISKKEFETQKYILNYLKPFNYEIKLAKTSVIVFINLNKNDIIGFRSEIDALPIKEENDVYYKSKNNYMHACGHDGHMAINLYLCKYIFEHKKELNHNYLIIFQSSEEKYGGAKSIVNDNFFKNHKPKYLFAIHLFPYLKEGKIYSRCGSFLAMCCEIDINIYGKSTHIFNSDNGVDSIKISNEFISELYDYFNTFNKKYTRFLIGKIKGGKARNVMCDKVEINMTLRNFNKNDYLKQKRKMLEMKELFENKYNNIIEIHFNDDFAPVINDSFLLKKVKEKNKVFLTSRKIIGDDFSTYQKECLTNYFLLGVNSKYFLHENKFDFNDSILINGLYFFINLLNL